MLFSCFYGSSPDGFVARSKLPAYSNDVAHLSFRPAEVGEGMTGHPCRIRCSIVVSISACHAEDPGSIPGGGALDVLRRAFSTAHVLMHGSVPCCGLTCHVPLLCTQARLLLQWQIIFKLCIKRLFWLLFDMTGPAAAHPVSASDSCGVRTHALTDWRLKPAP